MLPLYTIPFVALAVLYAALMAVYRAGWRMEARPPDPRRESGERLKTGGAVAVTVIIPARNEAAVIGNCIRAVLAQDYPAHRVEIVVVDDHSEDETAAVAAGFGGRVRVVRMQDEHSAMRYKKGALAAGIRHSTGGLIVTTDADCIAPPGWLRAIAGFYERYTPALIAGPVAFERGGTVLAHFQTLDFMSMQGITAAAHRLRLGDMANGANLAFTRAAYDAVGGYAGIDGLASGDDFLLLHKMRRQFPGGIQYLRAQDAIVQTSPQPTWGGFLQQRIRWASKSGKYPDHRLTGILMFVYLFNCAIAALVIAGCASPRLWLVAAGMVAMKWASELVFLLPVAHFYKKRRLLLWLLPLQPLHIAYIVVAGFLGLTGSYRWKGRRLR